jgi:saccharopine dehydrogenase-like NADP-dependent oxidoreductase
MKIVVLGALGEVGRHVARDLAQQPEIDELVLADTRKDEEVLSQVLRSGGRATFSEVDAVRERQKLRKLLADADLLMNCTPFPLFDNVFSVALDSGVNYADLISEPTREQRERCVESGITAVSGLGLTPGTSNVLCAHGARSLESVKEFHIHWVSFRSMAPSEGLLETILWELRDDCPTRQYYQNGRYVWSRPMEGGKVVAFPEPVGEQRVYVVPHTETTTLPRHFPSVQFVAVRGTWRPDLMADIEVLNRYGLLDDVSLDDGPERVTALSATRKRIWTKIGGLRETWHQWCFYLVVDVVGMRKGSMVSRTYRVWHDDWGTEGTGRMTGVNAAIGALLLARRGRRAVGFTDPEEYFDPDEYLEELQTRDGIHVDWSETSVSTSVLERAA